MARRIRGPRDPRLGGNPVWREGDDRQQQHHLDVKGHGRHRRQALETRLNSIVGVVTNGLFAHRGADVVLISTPRV